MADPLLDRVRAWRPSVPGVAEVFHARFTAHAYPAHTHSTWTLFLVDDGAIRYRLDRSTHGSAGSVVTVLPPHVVHDGRPATTKGFGKRVLYLDGAALDEGLIGRAVDRPAVRDRLLAERLSALHQVLSRRGEEWEAESRLALILERLRAHLGARPDDAEVPPRSAVAERLRALLDDNVGQPVTLAAAAGSMHVSVAHLVRSFSDAYGVPPHAYLLGKRVEQARWRLLEGQPIAQVAADLGFHDQAHLTRHFKRHVGTTPGRFRRGVRAHEDPVM